MTIEQMLANLHTMAEKTSTVKVSPTIAKK